MSFTISQSFFKLMSAESVMPSKHLILCRPMLLLYLIFPSFRAFSNGSYLHIRLPNFGPLDSVSVLPMNIQDWFPLWLTGLSSLQSKGLSRAFFCTTVWKQQFYGPQPFLLSNSHIRTYWKNHGFNYMDLCQQSNVSAFLIYCLHFSLLSSKEQASFSFMAAVTVQSDFFRQRKWRLSLFPFFFSFICIKWWDWMTWSLFFWMLSYKPAFSLSISTFIKIPVCASSSSAFCMM